MSFVHSVMLALALIAPAPLSSTPSPTLIEEARRATESFRDINNLPATYAPALGCVSGPLQGAMGVHFINSGLVDGVPDPSQPEAVIYEFKNGVARLVGVEYIVIASAWHQTHEPQDPPVIGGQLMQFEDSPNRFGLPQFYQLHVWAWRDNPNGAFVDWNTRVSCEGEVVFGRSVDGGLHVTAR